MYRKSWLKLSSIASLAQLFQVSQTTLREAIHVKAPSFASTESLVDPWKSNLMQFPMNYHPLNCFQRMVLDEFDQSELHMRNNIRKGDSFFKITKFKAKVRSSKSTLERRHEPNRTQLLLTNKEPHGQDLHSYP
jgi:hypothetical protein